MYKILIALAATAAAISTPALANEGRIEARAGVAWTSGATEDIYGVAAGYDFDLGSTAIAGVEVSADKIASSGTGMNLGFTGRLGTRVGAQGKLLADGGYTVNTCAGCPDAVHAGAAFEQGFGNNLYGKIGYRHFFVNSGVSDYDAVAVGLGVRF